MAVLHMKTRPKNVFLCTHLGIHFTDPRGEMEVVRLTSGYRAGQYALITSSDGGHTFEDAEDTPDETFVEIGPVQTGRGAKHFGCEKVIAISHA